MGCVNAIVTELCIIECAPGKLTVVAVAPGVTEEEIRRKTEAELYFAPDLREMLAE